MIAAEQFEAPVRKCEAHGSGEEGYVKAGNRCCPSGIGGYVLLVLVGSEVTITLLVCRCSSTEATYRVLASRRPSSPFPWSSRAPGDASSAPKACATASTDAPELFAADRTGFARELQPRAARVLLNEDCNAAWPDSRLGAAGWYATT